jgi:Protein of unknown function (DUF3237)
MKPIQPPMLDHLFSCQAMLHAPEIIGPVPEGIRVNFYVTGGTIEGPRLRGTTLPVGGDWLTIRSSASQYRWLHRLLCASTGLVDFERSEVRYDVFAIG